jgi:hypothetical protein
LLRAGFCHELLTHGKGNEEAGYDERNKKHYGRKLRENPDRDGWRD